ncbi:MAG: hypothetical protein QM727_08975 [Niabella sp.]
MRWLIFLSRVAFLSGIVMLLAFLLLLTQNSGEMVSSSVLLAGYGLAVVALPLTGLAYLVSAILGQKPFSLIPRWLFVGNILFLFILLIYIFYAHDPFYHQ